MFFSKEKNQTRRGKSHPLGGTMDLSRSLIEFIGEIYALFCNLARTFEN
jgi:hypothetical protein